MSPNGGKTSFNFKPYYINENSQTNTGPRFWQRCNSNSINVLATQQFRVVIWGCDVIQHQGQTFHAAMSKLPALVMLAQWRQVHYLYSERQAGSEVQYFIRQYYRTWTVAWYGSILYCTSHLKAGGKNDFKEGNDSWKASKIPTWSTQSWSTHLRKWTQWSFNTCQLVKCTYHQARVWRLSCLLHIYHNESTTTVDYRTRPPKSSFMLYSKSAKDKNHSSTVLNSHWELQYVMKMQHWQIL